MAFTKQPYAGDSNGDLASRHEKKPVLQTLFGLTSNMSTQDYVTAGGETYATAAELVPFKANRSYVAYARRDVASSTVKTTTRVLFANSATT